MRIPKYVVILLLSVLLLHSCKPEDKKDKDKPVIVDVIERPDFASDSAYYFVQKQVDLGPRVPGTTTHKATAEWLETKLAEYADSVTTQEASAKMYNGNTIPIYNIIASFNPDATPRVLLAAHWDTRHIAEKDVDPALQTKPIDGANDGGSGVGVLLEIARQLKLTGTEKGIDIILFDAEDLGDPKGGAPETWCLGSQHWAQNPHKANYQAKYGILLDLVGSPNAVFKYEQVAMRKAGSLYSDVWNVARELGYGFLFRAEQGGNITDDHHFVMKYRGFPMIDIIDYDPNRAGGFGEYHHTHNDNMDAISAETLRAVGEVVLAYVNEN